MKELRFCHEKNSDNRDYQHKVLIQREMEVNGMWIIVNVEKTLSPPLPSTRLSRLRSPHRFPLPFNLRSVLLSAPRSFFRSVPPSVPGSECPLRPTLRSSLPSPLRSSLSSFFYSVHCRQKNTKFYHLITLDNYWTSSTPLISYRCARLSQVVR